MKKLLLLLLLSFGFIGSANADAVCNDGWMSKSEGSGTCSWHNGVAQWYPDGTFDNNSQDECYQFNPNDAQIGVGYTNVPMLLGFSAGCMPANNTFSYGDTNAFMIGAQSGAKGFSSSLGKLGGFQVQDEEGSVINDIANAIAEGIANENTSKKKKNFNLPANSYTTSTGVWKCNNGYYEKDDFCKRIPANAFSYANGFKCESGYKKIRNTYCLKVSTQATYTKKEVSNSQTVSSSLKSKAKTTKKQSLSDLLGTLFIGLPLIGLVFWWLFKDIILILYSSIMKFIKRFINKN